MGGKELISKGDRVSARYQGKNAAYPGTVQKVNSDGTFAILYDDEDSESRVERDWIIGLLNKNDLVEGQKVLARHRGDRNNPEYPGIIKRLNKDGSVDVNYENGDTDKKIPASAVRKVVKRKKGDGSAGTNPQALELKLGDRVMCKFQGNPTGSEYAGEVSKVYGGKEKLIDVTYDDGDMDRRIPMSAARLIKGRNGQRKSKMRLDGDGDVSDCEVLDSRFTVSQRVLARFNGQRNSKEYKGIVSKVHADGTYDIKYDDGDVDNKLSSKFIRLDCENEDKSGKSSSPESFSEEVESQDDGGSNESNSDGSSYENYESRSIRKIKVFSLVSKKLNENAKLCRGTPVMVQQFRKSSKETRSGGNCTCT